MAKPSYLLRKREGFLEEETEAWVLERAGVLHWWDRTQEFCLPGPIPVD